MSLPMHTPRGRRQQPLRQQRSGQLSSAHGGSSAGLLGTIRSVVTAPLNWFGGISELAASEPADGDAVMEETGDKRRHHSPGAEPIAKRVRRASPVRDDEEHIPRLPPPAPLPLPPFARKVLSNDHSKIAFPAQLGQAVVVSQAVKRGVVRSQSLALPTSSFGRAPAPSSSLRNSVERHMSVDPPNTTGFSSRDSVLARSSMFMNRGQSLTRADSVGPHRSPTHARLTPMSSGASFGPLPPRKSRDPSAPPLLAGTVDSRRSPFKTSLQRTTSATHVPSSLSTSSTFGPLSSANSDLSRLAWNAPLTSAPSSESSKPAVALQNAADIVFQKAEANRTPLLPSQPTISAQALANLRRPRVKVPIPVQEADIGNFKKSVREPPTSPAPYNAGSSGLKRLLARRREEELRESTGHKDASIGTSPEPEPTAAPKPLTATRQTSIMEVDDDDKPIPKKTLPTAGPSRVISAPPSPAGPRNAGASAAAAARGPSLRAPKSNEFSKRTHQRSANKFSAIMEEEEDENADLPTEEELMKLASAAPIEFKLPTGFSFPKTTVTNPATAAPTTSSSAFTFPSASKSAESAPPSALGSAFSFATKPTATTTAEPAVAPKPVNIFVSPPPSASKSSATFSFAPSPGKSTHIPTSIFSSTFSSSHPQADVDNPMDDSEPEPAPAPVPAPKPAMPSFFPSVASPAAAIPAASEPPKSFSFGSAPPLFGSGAADKKDVGMAPATAAPTLSFGAPASASADKPPAFGGFGALTTSTVPSFSGFNKPASEAAKPVEAPKTFSFGPPAAAATSAAPAKPAEAPKLFSFGSSTAATAPAVTAAPAQAVEAPKSFSFGPPAAASTPAAPVEAPKTFSFGPPAAASTPAAPAKPLEAPKPFSFGSSIVTPATEQPSTSSVPFSFGGPASTAPKPTGLTTPPPTDEMRMQESPERPTPAPAFSSSTTSAPSGSLFSFGGPPKPPAINTSSTGGMFAFGATAGAAPAATPAAVSPFNTTPAASTSTPFSFGQSSTTPAAEPPKPAGSFSFGATASAAEAPKPATTSAPFSFGSAPASGSSTAPFSFGGASAPAAAEAPKPASSPFSFGAAAAAPAEPKPASPFSFGNGEAAKPATPFGFGSQNGAPAQPSGGTFSFGQPAEISRPASSASTPFTFGATNPATAAPSFGGTAPASPAFGFGHPPLPDVARAASPFATPQPPSQPQSPFNAPQSFGAAPPAPAAGPGFSFNTNPAAAGINNPFSQPSSPVNPPGFTLGAPDTRQTKPMPRRRTQRR